MDTTGISGSIPQTDASTAKYVNSAQSADQLRMDFLKMLTAQLQYQDPLEPEKNSEFTSQLAQFSGLSEQQKSNELLQQLIGSQGVNQMNQAVSYIGKVAVVDGNRMTMSGGEGTVRFEMPADGPVTINLVDANGRLVKTFGGQAAAGDRSVPVQDAALADGEYYVSVTTVGEDGKEMVVPTREAGVVKAVINGTSGVTLDLNGRRVSLADVLQVEQG